MQLKLAEYLLMLCLLFVITKGKRQQKCWASVDSRVHCFTRIMLYTMLKNSFSVVYKESSKPEEIVLVCGWFSEDLDCLAGLSYSYRLCDSRTVCVEINSTLNCIKDGRFVFTEYSKNPVNCPLNEALTDILSLTVDGKKVSGSHLVEEGQKITVACISFGPFRLLDQHGRQLNCENNKENMCSSFAVNCTDDWPTVRCEENSSQNKRLVSFLVRCPPMFVDNSTKVVKNTNKTLSFRVKAHTTAISSCLFTSMSLEDTNVKDVSCSLKGIPPNLVLSVELGNEIISEGTWMLVVINERGSAKIYIKVINGSAFHRIRGMMVDGREISGDHLISEGQNITVTCSSEILENSPTPLRLLDKSGQELTRAKSKSYVSKSFAIRCEDDWPTINCEGVEGEYNKSVSFLVRCPPQFADNVTLSVNDMTIDTLMLPVKAHTTKLNQCLLKSSSLGHNYTREINCTIKGNPPDLVLSLQLNQQNNSVYGKWTLILSNESGFSKTTINVIKGSNKKVITLTILVRRYWMLRGNN